MVGKSLNDIECQQNGRKINIGVGLLLEQGTWVGDWGWDDGLEEAVLPCPKLDQTV